MRALVRVGLAGVLAGACAGPNAVASRGTGTSLNIVLPNIDGEDVDVRAQGADEVLLLVFWATWCQPCQSELAKMDEMYAARADRGLRMYAINIDGPDTAAQVPTWSRREGYRFEVLLDGETNVLNRYNPKGDIPFYVVLDAKGVVLRSHQGYNDGDVDALANYLDGRLETPFAKDPDTGSVEP